MTVFPLLVIVHALAATVWTGGHLVLDLGVLPRALRAQSAAQIRAFEEVFEPLGLTALAIQVLSEAGLKIQLHPNGTAIEGEWGPVFTAIEACHQAVHAMGCPRVYTTVKINTRTDKDQTLEDKVASVQALL